MCENKLTLRLKEQIESLKGGVSEAASHLGKSRNTIYNWIDKGNAPVDQLEKLAEIGIDIQYIITGTRSPGKNIISTRHADKISEGPGSYSQAGNGTESPAAGSSAPASLRELDARLDSVINDYFQNDILSIINETLDHELSNKNLSFDTASKACLIAAAQKGYQLLAASRRTENFQDLLLTLIDTALADQNN